MRIEPLISRVLENGVWVAISQGENYRLRKPEIPSEYVTENLSENVNEHPVTDAEMISNDYDGYDDEDNEENGYGYYYEDGSDEEDDLMLYGDTGIPASVWEEFRRKKEQGM